MVPNDRDRSTQGLSGPVPILLEDVRRVGDHELLFLWNNGERSLWAFKALRFHFPCAGCIDEHTGARMIRPEAIPDTVQILDWKWVGNYAIQFRWSDGHQTGIYSFDYLRKLNK